MNLRFLIFDFRFPELQIKNQESKIQGVTLVELLIVMSALAMVMIAVVPHIRSSRQVWEIVGDRHADVLQNARIGMDKMTRELRQARTISDAGSSYIEFADRDENDRKFQYNAGYLEYGPLGDLSILSGPVSSLSFTYYEEDGVTETTTPDEVRSVLIQLETSDSEAKVAPIALSSRVFIRKDASVGGRTIVINEIMYNPVGRDNQWEWVELHNSTGADIDVAGWKFDDKTMGSIISTVIPAGGYATITRKNSSVYWLFLLFLPSDVAKLHVDGNLGLGNNGDTITIWNGSDEVDSVSYDDSWGGDGNGRTLERIDPQGDSNDPGNWEEGNSPGSQN